MPAKIKPARWRVLYQIAPWPSRVRTATVRCPTACGARGLVRERLKKKHGAKNVRLLRRQYRYPIGLGATRGNPWGLDVVLMKLSLKESKPVATRVMLGFRTKNAAERFAMNLFRRHRELRRR